MAQPNLVEIRILASGAEQASKVLQGVADAGAKVGSAVTTGAKQGEQALNGFGRSLTGVSGLMQQAGVNTGIFGQAVAALTSPMGLAGAAAVALGLGIQKATQAMVENARQVRELQAVSGLSASAADQLADTFDVLGKDTGTLTTAMFRMSQAIDAGGTELQKLGVTLLDSSGQLKTEGALFLEVRDRISELGTASERSAALMKIFGRGGRELADVFALTRTEFQRLHAEQGGWTEDMQQRTREYEIETRKLGKAWEDLWLTMGTPLVSTGGAVLKWINEMIAATKQLSAAQEENARIHAPAWAEALDSTRRAAKAATDQLALLQAMAAAGGAGPVVAIDPKTLPLFEQASEAVKKLRQELELLKASDAERPIIKYRQAFEEFAAKFGATQPGLVAQAKQLYDALAGQTRLEQARQTTETLIKDWVAYAEAVLAETERAQLAEAKLTDEARALEARMLAENIAGWVAYADAVIAETERGLLAHVAITDKALEEERKALEAINREWVRQAETVIEETEREQRAIVEITNKAREFDDSLGAVTLQAQLFGQSFDAVGERLAIVRRRMEELAATAGGVVTPELARLKVEFDRLTEITRTRDLWRDLFGSITQGIDRVIEGLQQGTLTWKSFGEIAQQVIRSIAADLVNRLLKQAINPVIEGIIGLISGTAGGGGGVGGAVGAVAGGALTTIGPGGVQQAPGPAGSAGGFDVGSAVTIGTSLAKFGGAFQTIGVGIDAFNFAMEQGASVTNSFMYGLEAASGTVGVFGSVMAGATAAVSIALLAMRKDVTDAGKAVISSFYAAAAATFILGGPIGMIVGIGLGIVGFLLDITGVFEKASEDWLSFGTRLSETLGKEGEQLTIFGKDISKVTDLSGVAQSIEDFRHNIESAAGVGGFFETTKGLGPFQIPGIPGATGTEHEGGIRFDFAPFIADFQKGIDKILDSVRETISTKFADAAKLAMPGDLAQAFAEGMLGTLRKEFEDLVKSPTATVEDVKAFEERMKAVAGLIQVFALQALAIREIGAVAASALPPALVDAVQGGAARLREELVKLAKSGTATAEDLAALQQKIVTLGNAVALYQQLTQMLAVLSGQIGQTTEQMILGITMQQEAAARAVDDGVEAYQKATTPETQIAALTALSQAVIQRYALERQLLAQIEQTIQNLLSSVGDNLAENLNIAISAGLATGSTQRLATVVAALEELGAASGTASVKLWAATTAINALTAAMPAAVKAFAASIINPSAITATLVAAALPSLGIVGDMIGKAITAGDFQTALGLIGQGAGMIKQIAASAIAGIEQWRDLAIAYAQSIAEEQIAAIEATASADIELLEAQRRIIEKNIALSREWERAADSLQAALDQLRPGNLAPPNAQQQFAAAMSTFQRILAEAQTSPEAAAQLGSAAQTLLQTALNTGLMTLPSPEYRELFEMVTAELERARELAESRITPEEAAAASLESIDAEIQAVRDNADAQIKAIREGTAAWIGAINAAADKAIEEVNKGLGDAMWAISAVQADLLGKLITQQEAARNAITKGLTIQAFLAAEAANQHAELSLIREALQKAIFGVTSPPPVATPPAVLGAGGIVTKPTLALIGEAGPEAVIPLNGGAGGVVINVDARGATDPEATATAVRRAIREALREGEAREMVRELARRA